ncbi:hypothetical protein AVEN_122974-1 [Araneus ventricosus]|uniref:Uncharacterized protein n=1 Tax=Araneus ventricosus TaxID=182803 RepID=A0A4Y2LA93_ARAVE|nr:hypothetical protein AVEN_122974-1 [Araneus ventricosus]
MTKSPISRRSGISKLGLFVGTLYMNTEVNTLCAGYELGQLHNYLSHDSAFLIRSCQSMTKSPISRRSGISKFGHFVGTLYMNTTGVKLMVEGGCAASF